MELMFKSVKDAIRFRLFLTSNGLQDSFVEKRSQFIYSLNDPVTKHGHYVTAIVSFIQDYKRSEWLNKMLLEKYRYENEDERGEIIEIVTQMCHGEREELTNLVEPFNEYEWIKIAVLDLLEFKGAVAFDSFLRFRLRSYYQQLHRYLEVAIDEYKMEQDYQMFVHMLREYLHKRQTRKSIIHITMDKSIHFYDEQLQVLSQENIKALLDRRLLSNHPIYVDSKVIAPLLSIAPEKIFIYTDEEDQPLLRTLVNIFEERITIFSSHYFYALSNAYSAD